MASGFCRRGDVLDRTELEVTFRGLNPEGGVSRGLLLSGPIFALLFAYVVRIFAVSLYTVEARLAKVTNIMDGVARTLGSRPVVTQTRVHGESVAHGAINIVAAGLLFVALLDIAISRARAGWAPVEAES